MKIDINDPRITAFALGELTGNDAIEIARAMHTDMRIRDAVDQARETATLLHGTLGGEEVHMLTAKQRAAVRSVGNDTTITDLASAKVSFWKNPAVVGSGVAAAIALGAFFINQSQSDIPNDKNVLTSWDWSEVGMEDLTSPAVAEAAVEPAPSGGSESSATAVAAAMSEDTANFRKELNKRIGKQDVNMIPKLPELEEQGWKVAADKEGFDLPVPLASGAASWPILEKYLNQLSALPPKSSVRIEEMVNHFTYKTPSMLSGAGLVADIELCHTPWNPTTMLVAIHMSYVTDASVTAKPRVVFTGEQVKRARLLGYSEAKEGGSGAPRHLSKTHGNYALFEVEFSVKDSSDSGHTAVTLILGDQSSEKLSLSIDSASSWLTASEDLRFASSVTAAGMLLVSTSSSGELDATRLVSMLDVIGKQQTTTTPYERKSALPVLKKVAQLLLLSSEPGK